MALSKEQLEHMKNKYYLLYHADNEEINKKVDNTFIHILKNKGFTKNNKK